MPCRSLTSLRNKFRAVIFFYRHLLSPIASIFGSGMPYAARTFLSHPPVENASDKPEHCFRNAKIAKKFDLTANFSEFLNSFRFLGMILLLSHPERLTFRSSFLLFRSHSFAYQEVLISYTKLSFFRKVANNCKNRAILV